ncbi:pyridoxamine 5'-phosphate oxidase family protein [Streptomyces litchfieldiae]|uniref:Pyridoxamine 5'-phosphate oxidase family protein n=1 Tax=Streptomyces litchfieldiae TaxID=3075543 RepID=A0ABU2MQF0_9ACTN|nr:pyridoxamine 5'-phosphate oxidase family protein [Streptomyces sp. DSM 44938]MDT0343841.1 pyridoxamine 5'-phosphate oxidase family protein [Streptomyces sp. DSM 44938]
MPPTGPAAPYPQTTRTTPTRSRHRVSYDRELVHGILDEGYLCHLGFVRDGRPVVLPTLYARDGERLYVHGSTGARVVRAAGEPGPGLPVCLTVTHVDGLVLARSAFHHSVNYRSVVVHGTARPVTDEAAKRRAFDLVVDHVIPGRSADCRPADARELAATAVLELDLAEVSAKVRTGGPNDDPEDLSLPYWSGVLPVTTVHGAPVPAGGPGETPPAPAYLTGYARP